MKFMLSCLIVFFCFLSINLNADQKSTFVHLFEWSWADIAIECETHLGPKGFKAVQVSPPQKSDTGGTEWWRAYQPVSYAIEGRKGDREAFRNMIQRCEAAGVDIYVDAVINHMAAWDRVFPEVPYFPEHFHNCRDDIDYRVREQVQNCDLLGLNDLKTEDSYVQDKIAAYLNDLISLGVKGIRIDAAKHIPAVDIENILSRLSSDIFIFLEVIGSGEEPIKVGEYTHLGRVTEFNFEKTIGHFFKGRGPLTELRNIGLWDGWLASDDAVVFVSNHDDQRGSANYVLNYKDGIDLYRLGEIFMLAYPYGYPKVMSSYYFDNFDEGAPLQGPNSGDACLDGGWVCEHRMREIANMVTFRKVAGGNELRHWWDNGNNQIAFARGDKGFVVINLEEGSTLQQSLQTGLAEGEYCDVINGDYNEELKTCDGPTILVDSEGMANFNVASFRASATHAEAKVEPECLSDCPDVWKQAYFRGTPNQWQLSSMERVGDSWVTEQFFNSGDENGPARFKITRYANWDEAYPKNDYVIHEGAGTYRIEFDSRSAEVAEVRKLSSPETVTTTFVCDDGYTYWGQSVYIVGNTSLLGEWSPAFARKLEPSAYPRWTGIFDIPYGENIEWKCIKRDENNPSEGIVWQAGSNNIYSSIYDGSVFTSF